MYATSVNFAMFRAAMFGRPIVLHDRGCSEAEIPCNTYTDVQCLETQRK